MIGRILFAVFIAFSGRTAKIQPNPYDYQIKGGARSYYGDVEGKYERENGDFYRGVYLRTNPFGESTTLNIFNPRFVESISGEIKIDEADAINNQYLYKCFLDWDILKFRSTNQWAHWKNHRWLGGLEINFTTPQITTRFEYDTNLNDRHIGRFNFDYKYLISDIAYLMPAYNYETHDGVNNWKVSIEYGIDFAELYNRKQKEEEQRRLKEKRRALINKKTRKTVKEINELELLAIDMVKNKYELGYDLKDVRGILNYEAENYNEQRENKF